MKLTEFSKGAGCGCKISPAVLKEILHTPDIFPPDPRLIVGNDTNDDAAVIALSEDLYLVNTTDFFTPVVDNAYDFGRIAATNALSDVYAMGGKPITALAILGWPTEKISATVASEVLEGARAMCRMAGITLAGGHSIESAEPIFGMAVSGLVKKENLKRNSTARAGDFIFLTKPLGMGIVTTAAKRGLVENDDMATCIGYMCTLNKFGEALGDLAGVTALTDVTGFGFLGHLIEMCEGAQLSAQVEFKKIPVFPFLDKYLKQFIYPDITTKNFSYYSAKVSSLSAEQLFTLCDPQTSGGLLVAVAEEAVDLYLQVARDFGLQGIADQCVGRFVEMESVLVSVR